MKGSGIPDGWLTTSVIGNPVSGTSFLAFKVPLSDALCKNIPKQERFTPTILLEKEPNLRLIIDLTATKRYYNPNDFIERGLRYEKILCPGRQIPKAYLMNRFFHLVDEFMASKYTEGKFIGVHCTHGINRTGYFICTYMIKRMGFTPDEAISKFQEARGEDIVRDYFITELNKAYSENNHQKNHRNRLHPSQSSFPQRAHFKFGNRPRGAAPDLSNLKKNPYKLDNRRKRGPFNNSTPSPANISSKKALLENPLSTAPSIVTSSKKSKKRKSISINPFSADPSSKTSTSTKQSQEDPSDNSISSALLDPVPANTQSKKTLLENPLSAGSSSKKPKKKKSISINPFSTDSSSKILSSTKHLQEDPSGNSKSSIPCDPTPKNPPSKKTLLENPLSTVPSAKKPKKKKSLTKNPFSKDSSSKVLSSTKHLQEDPLGTSKSSIPCDPTPKNPPSEKPLLENPLSKATSLKKPKKKKNVSKNHLEGNPSKISTKIKGSIKTKTSNSVLEVSS